MTANRLSGANEKVAQRCRTPNSDPQGGFYGSDEELRNVDLDERDGSGTAVWTEP